MPYWSKVHTPRRILYLKNRKVKRIMIIFKEVYFAGGDCIYCPNTEFVLEYVVVTIENGNDPENAYIQFRSNPNELPFCKTKCYSLSILRDFKKSVIMYNEGKCGEPHTLLFNRQGDLIAIDFIEWRNSREVLGVRKTPINPEGKYTGQAEEADWLIQYTIKDVQKDAWKIKLLVNYFRNEVYNVWYQGLIQKLINGPISKGHDDISMYNYYILGLYPCILTTVKIEDRVAEWRKEAKEKNWYTLEDVMNGKGAMAKYIRLLDWAMFLPFDKVDTTPFSKDPEPVVYADINDFL